MSHLNSPPWFRLFSALAGAFLFTAAAAWAQAPQGPPEASNSVPKLALTLQPGETVGQEQVVRELLRSGTNEFLFVLPQGMRTEVATDGRLVLSNWEQRYHISIRVLELPPSTPRLQQALREQLARQYPHAGSMEDFATTVADQPGRGFQFRVEQPGVGPRLIRSVCVPFRAGVMELTLNADTNSIPAAQQAFDQVLLTLRSNERGKLELVRRSDRT